MSNDYCFPRTEREYQRQILQAKMWERATRLALHNVPFVMGGHALDVGCGCGSAVPLLAERVGPRGLVTGIDFDTRAQALWSTTYKHITTCSVRFVEGNLAEREALAGERYDLVFARMVLLHLREAREALWRLWNCVRPGGTLLVLDYDLTSSSSFPQQPAIERALRFSIDAFRRQGLDVEIGSRMPTLFLEAGLPAPDGCEIASMILPAAPSVNMLRESLFSLRDPILRLTLADDSALERTDRELAAIANTDVHVRWPDMVATWKRKPS